MASNITPPGSPLRASTPSAPRKKPSLAARRGRLDRIPKLVLPNDSEEEEEQRKAKLPEWRALAQSGWVRPKFLATTPEDVSEIDDIDSLLKIRDLYFPASQPQNLFEESYCTLMREAVDSKLYSL